MFGGEEKVKEEVREALRELVRDVVYTFIRDVLAQRLAVKVVEEGEVKRRVKEKVSEIMREIARCGFARARIDSKAHEWLLKCLNTDLTTCLNEIELEKRRIGREFAESILTDLQLCKKLAIL